MHDSSSELIYSYSRVITLLIFPIIFALINLEKDLVPHYTWVLLLSCLLVTIIALWALLKPKTIVHPDSIKIVKLFKSYKIDRSELKGILAQKKGKIILVTKQAKNISLPAVTKNDLPDILDRLQVKL